MFHFVYQAMIEKQINEILFIDAYYFIDWKITNRVLKKELWQIYKKKWDLISPLIGDTTPMFGKDQIHISSLRRLKFVSHARRMSRTFVCKTQLLLVVTLVVNNSLLGLTTFGNVNYVDPI